jgi:hypothetical protein
MSTTLAFSQKLSQTIRGTLLDADSKMPLIGAIVIIPGTNPLIGTTTDVNGKYRLENIPIGRISLKLSYLGYEAKTISDIIVNSGKEVVLDFVMQESVVKINEIVVKANKNKGEALNEMSMISSRSISVAETNRYAGGFSDPSRVVANLAGVTNSPASSDIIVRGNSPKYMQWRLEGVEISSPYHLNDQNGSFGALSALNNNLLATSDFYTGAFSPEYGGVLSSVFDVKLRTGNNEKFEAAAGVGLLGVDFTLEGPFKKGYAGSYLINYRYSAASLIKKLGLVDVPGVVNYQDATFKVVLPTKKAGTFSIFGLGGLSGFAMENIEPTGLSVPGQPTNADILRDYNKAANLANIGISHVLTINSNSYIKTSLSYSAAVINDDVFDKRVVRIDDGQGGILSDTINKTLNFNSKIINASYTGATTYNNKLNAKNKVQIGAKYTISENKYNQSIFNNATQAMFNVTDFNNSISAINSFISWKHSFNDKINIVSGLHNMNVLINNKSTLEPRVAINWKLNNIGSFHAGYGKHSTMESVHNYFTKVEQQDGSVIEPNKNLGLLKADHYVLGFDNYFTEYIKASVEIYYQNLYNLPVENNDTSYYATINEGFDYRYVPLVNKGTGKNYGIEVTAERFFNKNYYFLINASLFDSKYKSLEGIERNTQYNSQYLVNILGGKEFKNIGKKQNQTLAINIKAFLGGGKKYIPLLRDAQGNVAVDPSNNRYWDYSKAYDKKLDDIFSLNLSVSYKFNKLKTTHEIFLDLQNITNYQGRVSEFYDTSKSGSIGYIRQMGFFPNLMYRVYF